MRKLIWLVLGASLTGAVAPAGIVTPGSTVGGKTIAEWGGEWWKWGMSFPAAATPFNDPALSHLGNVGGPVFFLNASSGTQIDYTIYNLEGQYLLFHHADRALLPITRIDRSGSPGCHPGVSGFDYGHLRHHRWGSASESLHA